MRSIIIVLLTSVIAACSTSGVADAVEGVDVSKYQADIDWSSAANGVSFAYARATEGITYVDDKFAKNWNGIKAAGLKRGAYHFYRTNDSASAQAQNFLAQFTMSSGDLLPMLDIEEGSIPVGVSADAASVQAGVIEWMDIVTKALGCTPILYTSPSFAESYLNDPKFTKYKLWIAEYGVKQPSTKTVWGANWTIWQYSQDKTLEGISGSVDADRYNSAAAGSFDSEMTCAG